VKPRVLARRPRHVLPLLAVLAAAGAGGAVIATSTAGAQSSSCQESFARSAAAVHPAALSSSGPCEAFGFGTVSVLSIRQGDASQLTITSSDPNASLDLRANLDPGITCLYHGRVFPGLSLDQYNVVVNGGSTVNEPTLTGKLGTAVTGGLSGAQFAILSGNAQICFGSPMPFQTLAGSALTTNTDLGTLQYVGLLPDCGSLRRGTIGPCITARSAAQIPTPTGNTGVVNVSFTVPPGFDPRLHG
jgi:hypothetical protein